MKPFITVVVLTVFGFTGTARPTEAADLKGIDRTIKKEPKYTTSARYALLAFGPEAKTKIWLVLDGDVLYVDRNGNGDLTEPNERFEIDAEATKRTKVAEADVYTGMNVFTLGEIEGVRLQLDQWVRNKEFTPKDDFDKQRLKNGWEIGSLMRIGKDGSRAQTPIVFCQKPVDAQVAHLSGPLEFTLKWGAEQSLKGGDRENVFDVHIGTPGLSTRNCPFPVFASLTPDDVPADVHPVADFEFPNKDAKQPPIKLSVRLDRRCCGDTFYGPVRVPAGAGIGKAKVVVSFPEWKAGKVAPTTFEVLIVEAQEKR